MAPAGAGFVCQISAPEQRQCGEGYDIIAAESGYYICAWAISAAPQKVAAHPPEAAIISAHRRFPAGAVSRTEVQG